MNNSFSKYREEKVQKEIKGKAHDALVKIKNNSEHAPRNFLEAWKDGIKIVGEEFFNIKSDTVDAATNKWQLAPNLEFIQQSSGGYSHGTQVLLALMYSYYDPDEGQKLLERFGTPNFITALAVLDIKGTEIITTLWLNYTGW